MSPLAMSPIASQNFATVYSWAACVKLRSASAVNFPFMIDCFGIRRHGQEQIRLMAASLESYLWGKARLAQSVGAANLKGNAPLDLSHE
jgi:hypothetical protein